MKCSYVAEFDLSNNLFNENITSQIGCVNDLISLTIFLLVRFHFFWKWTLYFIVWILVIIIS